MQFIFADKSISLHENEGEELVQKTCNTHFPFPDYSNITEGTFKLNHYAECVFGNRNNKVIMPKNKGLSLMSKKIII